MPKKASQLYFQRIQVMLICHARHPQIFHKQLISFRCSDGTCIPLQWHCDKEQDCDGGEDEKDCDTKDGKEVSQKCNDDEFTCKDKRCISVRMISLHYPLAAT